MIDFVKQYFIDMFGMALVDIMAFIYIVKSMIHLIKWIFKKFRNAIEV